MEARPYLRHCCALLGGGAGYVPILPCLHQWEPKKSFWILSHLPPLAGVLGDWSMPTLGISLQGDCAAAAATRASRIALNRTARLAMVDGCWGLRVSVATCGPQQQSSSRGESEKAFRGLGRLNCCGLPLCWELLVALTFKGRALRLAQQELRAQQVAYIAAIRATEQGCAAEGAPVRRCAAAAIRATTSARLPANCCC